MKPIWLLIVLAASSAAVACSGLHVQEDIIMLRAYGIIGLGIQVILAVPMYRWYRAVRRGPGHFLVSLLLAAIHPAWYWNGYGGDCGFADLTLSVGLLGIVVGLTIWQFEILAQAKKS